jgi:hypothetical protein
MDPFVAVADAYFCKFSDPFSQYGLLGSATPVPVTRAGEVDHRTGSSFRDPVTPTQVPGNVTLAGRP